MTFVSDVNCFGLFTYDCCKWKKEVYAINEVVNDSHVFRVQCFWNSS